MSRILFAEALGTFALVLAGTGAIVVDGLTGGALSNAGIAFVFGLTVLVLVHVLGDVSGAHVNPAVTLGFALARRFTWRRVPAYIGAQLVGAVAASMLLAALFGVDGGLGATTPRGSLPQSFAVELVATTALMLVVLSVSDGSRERGAQAAFTIAALVTVAACVAGPISGASINPARSIGPALVSGRVGELWLYCVAPVLGASLAVPICRGLRTPRCCDRGEVVA